MRSIVIWFGRLIALIGVLAAIALGLAYYLASHSLPNYTQRLEMAQVSAPVQIVRNASAVPHIFAASDEDALFALGFSHAQDRLFQMMLMRRAAQGLLSEAFGPRTYQTDLLVRSLDLYDHAGRVVTGLSPRTRALLQAYADGVNAQLRQVREEALGRGAPEFFLFSNQIAAWTPQDSAAIVSLLALRLSDQMAREVLRTRLRLRLDEERVADLMPQPPEAVMALPEFAQAPEHQINWSTAHLDEPLPPPAPFGPPPMGFAGASNAWAALGQRSASGSTLMANDPHLGLSAPSQWYLARLELSTGSVIGATIPGLPAIVIGRSDKLAWGVTASYLDDLDLYVERQDPNNPEAYLTPDGPVPFEARFEVIPVKGEAPRTEQFLKTRHGPVLPGSHLGLSGITPDGHRIAVAWSALSEGDLTLDGMMGIMGAGSVKEARLHAQKLVAPSLNLVLADRSTIALQSTGRMPLRGQNHASRGQMPVAGWVAQNDWQGFAPFEDMPFSLNPVGGIVVNTNNRLTEADYPKHFTYDWGDSQRIERARLLLGGRQFHTLDSFVEIQSDTVSPAARALLPLIGRELWYTDGPAPSDSPTRLRQQALEALAAWNGEMTEHGAEPLIYAAWVRALQRRLIIDEIGGLATGFAAPDPLFLERVFRNTDGAGSWCDVQTSVVVESCAQMASLALDEALIELSERYGSRFEAWRWGEAHAALHRHEVLGDLPLLQWLFNIRQSTGGGDHTIMRAQMPNAGPTPYANTHAAGFRMVVDFSDPDASRYIQSTGQSGHFLSRHYDDMSAPWRRGEYVSMSLDPVIARAGAVGITELLPKP